MTAPYVYTALWLLAGAALALVAAQGFVRVIWFRRQGFPETAVEWDEETRTITSPVDGHVVYRRRAEGCELVVEKQGRREAAYRFYADTPGWLIGLYMSPFDRHTVIAPCDGRAALMQRHYAARNLPMLDLLEYVRLFYFGRMFDWVERKAFGFIAENEKAVLQVGATWLVLIADRFVNKIEMLPPVARREYVHRNEPLAFIRRGSQVDVFVPDAGYQIVHHLVAVGDRVTAGDTLMERT